MESGYNHRDGRVTSHWLLKLSYWQRIRGSGDSPLPTSLPVALINSFNPNTAVFTSGPFPKGGISLTRF